MKNCVAFVACMIVTLSFTVVHGALKQPKTNPWRNISTAIAVLHPAPTAMDTEAEEKTPACANQDDSSANYTVEDLVTKTKILCVEGIFFSLLISSNIEDWTPYNEKLEEYLAKTLLSIDNVNVSTLPDKRIIDACYKTLYRIACSFASIINPVADDPQIQQLICQLNEASKTCGHITYFCNQITIYPPGFPTKENISKVIDLIESFFTFLYQYIDSINVPQNFTYQDGELFKEFCLKFDAKFKKYETTHEDFHKTSRYKLYEKRIFRKIKQGYQNGNMYATARKSNWYHFAANKQALLKILCSQRDSQTFIQHLDSNLTILGQHIGRYKNFDLFSAAIRAQINLN